MGLVLLLLKLKRKYVCYQLQQARDELQRYCSSVDTLLRLITEAVKYLQEMETLSKGYSRSVGSTCELSTGAPSGNELENPGQNVCNK